MRKSNQSVTKNPGSRKPKSPRSLQAGRTRARLLQAAVDLFAQRGFDGVSVDEIVARARVNKRMVYHYFGGKAEIYAAALASTFEKLSVLESDLFQDRPGIDAAVERIIRAYFAFLRETPEFVALLLWENLQGGKHLKYLDDAITKAPLLESLREIIAQGIRSGRMRPGIDRQHMLINLIGLCLVYFSNRHTLIRSVGIDLNDPAELERGLDHAIALAKRGFLHESPR